MNQKPVEEAIPRRLPEHTSEGMPVFDREGEAVGTVQVVYFGGASDEAIAKALTFRAAPDSGTNERYGSAFDADGVPDELRARLMRNGYIQIKGPDITSVQQYIIPEQIENIVSGQGVQLRVVRHELINS